MASNYVVERSTMIDAAPSAVFKKVANLQEWDDWSPWAEKDPNMDVTHAGEPGAPGSSYAWKGNRDVGEGKMTVREVDEPDRVSIDLAFLKPFKSETVVDWLVRPADSGSQVTWRMTGQHNLMSKVMGIFKSMDSMVGPDFEQGLAKLKNVMES